MEKVKITVPIGTIISNVKFEKTDGVELEIVPDIQFPCFIINTDIGNACYFIATGISGNELDGIGYLSKCTDGDLDYYQFKLKESYCDDIEYCRIMTDKEKSMYLKEISKKGYIWNNNELIKIKDGDILKLSYTNNFIIFKNIYEKTKVNAYLFYDKNRNDVSFNTTYACDTCDIVSLAKYEDIKLITQVLKEKGKFWNSDKNCIENIAWEPKYGEEYWTLCPWRTNGVIKYVFDGDSTDMYVIKNKLFYRTEEEVLVALSRAKNTNK